MNFLSHYYIDRSHASPTFAVGALLPDLFAGFTKIYNRKVKNLAVPIADTTVADLHQGVLRHYQADCVFHGHPDFLRCCNLLRDALLRNGLDRSEYRISFLAHIGVELLLDCHIVNQHSELLEAYYTHINNFEEQQLLPYFALLDEDAAGQLFFPTFRLFKQAQFLLHLKTIEGVAEGLSRTNEKVTGKALEGNNRKIILSSLYNIQQDIRYSSQTLLAI